jgi:hypothetical protein
MEMSRFVRSKTISMKKRLWWIPFLAISSMTFAQEARLDQLEKDVSYLASDKLEGREIGTKGEEKAAEYIAKRMEEMGLLPKGTEGYYQAFSVTPKANPHATVVDSTASPIHGKNVIGYIDNHADQLVIIGAHFDHLGKGGEGSLYTGGEAIHNGADDNASGVALMLQLAGEIEGKEGLSGSNYLFIGFSGEEKGLWGSNYYCKHPTVELGKVNYMINFDMVGRLDTSKGLAINGVGTSPAWKEKVQEVNKKELKLILGEAGVGPSDHTSFYLQDIPVLHLFTGQHEDYHKPSDDVEKLNLDGILLLRDMMLDLMTSVGEEKLAFTKTKEDESTTPRFTVTLGVMPDYMYQGDGMRIDGVSDGRPAKVAGFKKGDIVIQMGEIKVDGMQSYMEALSKFKKGDSTPVKVKRGEEIIEAEVTF